jgi:hypothetical protein
MCYCIMTGGKNIIKFIINISLLTVLPMVVLQVIINLFFDMFNI